MGVLDRYSVRRWYCTVTSPRYCYCTWPGTFPRREVLGGNGSVADGNGGDRDRTPWRGKSGRHTPREHTGTWQGEYRI